MSRAKYHSERRQEQAEATRQAILDAARSLFVERGYAGTTVADIAAAARVAVPTIYVSVGTKAAILGELRKLIPVDAGVPEQQDVLNRLAQATDPREVIGGFVAAVRRLIEVSGDLMFAIESAAPFEPVAAEAWQEGLVLHRAGWTMAIDRIVALGRLNKSMTPSRAVDIASFLSLPSTWRTLGKEYGWSNEEVSTWIESTAWALLIDRAR